MYAPVLITSSAHAQSGVKQWSVCHQHFGLIKGLNTSIRHSNNDNSENLAHGVPEGGFIRANFQLLQLFVAVVSSPDFTNQSGDETIVAEDTRS